MRVLRGTLTFVLGMVIGIVLFVVAIGGTLAILATQFTVGDLQKAIIGSDNVISSDSDIYDKTILDAVKDVVSDIQNFDKLSLKTLYEHYGIKLFKGISGIDFTDKDFYNVPIPDLINDLSIVVNSFTLNDVSKIAGVDFSSYNLPILTNNLDNNLSTAMDNILGSLNGDMTIRGINVNFGIDLGIADNALLGTLQDALLSEFGNVLNVMRVSSILEADTDTFVASDAGRIKYFAKTDAYEAIPDSELSATVFADGAEKSLLGGLDTDGDGKADAPRYVETRYVQEIRTVDGKEEVTYVVDNSSYGEDFDLAANQKTFYRHIIYTPTDRTEGENVYIIGYANRVGKLTENGFELLEKGFVPVSGLAPEDGLWAMTGDVPDKDSKLAQLEDGQSADVTFRRVHTGTSTALLQSIAHLTIAELQDADNLLDGLTIADVVDITPESAKIMKSLAARNCKLTELGTVANDLTLGEMIDVSTYRYSKSASGKYVRIEDEASYTLYDRTNPDFEGATRYRKNPDGSFTPDVNGKFVHSVYYTLYNPAAHANLTRYDRLPLGDGENVSSALLQRFTGATLGNFSDAFDSLMLADVLQIDADVYEPVSSGDIAANPDERYFYYDSAHSVYRVADSEYIANNPDVQYYHIAYSGEGTSFIKKLAYVKIDGMADAMDIIIDDMMLSEFIDVFTEDAVELFAHSGSVSADGRYFIEYGAGGNAYEDGDGNRYVFVYDKFGDFAKANFREAEVNNNITEATIYYRYVKYSDMMGTEAEKAIKTAKLTAEGNIYYYEDGEYKRNLALCSYMLTKTEYHNQIYYREKVSAGGADVFTGAMKVYSGTTLPYGAYVKDEFLGYIAYDVNNPVFADRPLITFEKADGEDYFINKADAKHMAKAIGGEFVSRDLYYALRQCVDVYALTSDTENSYVFVDGKYVRYDASVHAADAPRFLRKSGYIGGINEVSYNDGANTELILQDVKFIRERSAPVLRMLSRGTIGEMNKIISNATIGDVVDAEPDSMLGKPIIKDAKLSELGTVFKDILTDMTIGELMTWSNVTEVEDYVKTALNGVTVQSLFSSLTLDTTTNEIKVDMLKLYGYTPV